MRLFKSAQLPEFVATLPAGERLRIQFVRPTHAPLFEAGYAKLSARSKRLRFLGQSSGLSSKQLAFLTEPDGKVHIAYAAQEADGLAPVAVARAIRLDSDSEIAEVALTVIDDWQGRGVGMLLHACLHMHAAAVGMQQFIYDVSVDNGPFIAHLENLGAALVSRDRDQVRLTLPVYGSAKAVLLHTEAAEALRQRLQEIAGL